MGPQNVNIYMQCCKVNVTAVPTVTIPGIHQTVLV